MSLLKSIVNKPSLIAGLLIGCSFIQAHAAESSNWGKTEAKNYQVMNNRTVSIEIDPTMAARYIRYGYVQLMPVNIETDEYFVLTLSPKENDLNVSKNCITQGSSGVIKWSHEGQYAPKSRALNCDVSKTEKSYINVQGKNCPNNSYCNFRLVNYLFGQAGGIKVGDHNDQFSEQKPIQISSLQWGNKDDLTNTVEQGKVIAYRVDPKAGANLEMNMGAIVLTKGKNVGNYKIVISDIPGNLNPSAKNCISQSGSSVNLRWGKNKSSGYCTVPSDEIFYVNITSDKCDNQEGCDFKIKNLYK